MGFGFVKFGFVKFAAGFIGNVLSFVLATANGFPLSLYLLTVNQVLSDEHLGHFFCHKHAF